MQKIVFWCGGFASLLLLWINPLTVFSEEKENAINQFSYDIIYPETQQNKKLGYFDFKLEPNAKQKVMIKLNNTGKKELNVLVQLNDAKTNSNGEIEYGTNDIPKDDSAKVTFTNVVKGPKEVKIAGGTSKTIELAVDLPENTDPGIILGAIQLQPQQAQSKNDSNTRNIVVNEFAYVIGMLMRVGDTSQVKPDLKFHRVYTSIKNEQSKLFIKYSNTQAAILEDMNVSVSVRKKNKQNSIFDYKKTKMRMAPNSMIDLPIELGDKNISAGDYTAQISVKAGKGKSWSWKEDFYLNSSEVAAIAKSVANDTKKNNLLSWLTIPAVISVGAGFLFFKKKKTKKRNKTKKRSKRRK